MKEEESLGVKGQDRRLLEANVVHSALLIIILLPSLERVIFFSTTDVASFALLFHSSGRYIFFCPSGDCGS